VSEHTSDVQSFISKELHSFLFLEEFVFSRNKFSPPIGTEIEFADAVVMLGDVLLIFQIKERFCGEAGDAVSERRWFTSKVIRKATKQLRNTVSYLNSYSEIRVPNERGHIFNLAAGAYADIVKLIVYLPAAELPAACRGIRHYLSKSAGFIHIVDARDYLQLSRTLCVPEEVVRYFRYREMVLTRFASACANLPEPAIAGHFIGGDVEVPPVVGSEAHLHRLVQDPQEWDLRPFTRELHRGLAVPGISDDYYDILIEFAKLPRSIWRKVKERIRLCIENVKQDELVKPYRIVYPHTDCGFVFIPVPSLIARRRDWEVIRLRSLHNFTAAHKYEQRLSKCIGILVAMSEDSVDIFWSLIEHEWIEDPEMQRALDQDFPLRPVKVVEESGYRFIER
jgi:hypothetical protein